MEGLLEVGKVVGMIIVIMAVAFLTESTVEYIFGTLTKNVEKLEKFKWLSLYVALLVGVGIAFYYKFDLVALLGETVGLQIPVGYPGIILTGAGIGRGANYIHDFWSKYFKKPDQE